MHLSLNYEMVQVTYQGKNKMNQTFQKKLNEIFVKITENRFFLFYAFIFLTIIITGFYTLNIHELTPTYGVQTRWLACIEYMKQGTLYNNVPTCIEGPVLLSTIYLINKMFGSPNYTILLIGMLNALALILIYKIVKKITGKSHFLLISLLYTFLIIDVIGYIDLASLMSITFLVMGFYYLYWCPEHLNKLHHFIVGIAFSASILSKFASIIPIVIIYTFYIFDLKIISFKGLKLKINKEKTAFIKALIPATIILTIFMFIWPNMLNYTIFAVMEGGKINPDSMHPPPNVTQWSYPSAFVYVLSYLTFNFTDFYSIIMKTIFLLSLFYFYKKRKVYAAISSIGLFALYVITQHSYGAGQTTLSRYIISTIPFFIITFSVMYDSFNKKSRAWQYVCLTTMFILIFSLAWHSSILKETLRFYVKGDITQTEKEINDILNLLPTQSGRILNINDNLQDKYMNKLFGEEKNDNMFLKEMVDRDYGPGLEKAGLVNRDEYAKNYFQPYKEKIESGEYSMIIYGPYVQGVYLDYLLKWFVKDELEKNWCSVYVPNYEHHGKGASHLVLVYFRNKEDCNKMRESMLNYYNQKFDSICQKSKFAANIMVNVQLNQASGVPFNKICNNNGFDAIEYYDDPIGYYFSKK